MKALIALALAAATVRLQEKTYDLTLETKPILGGKSARVDKQFVKMIMKVNGQPAGKLEKYKELAASEEILAVDSDTATKRRWTFSKAKHKLEGSVVPYPFQGKIVEMSIAKGKDPAFVLEGGGELTKEDLEDLKSYAGLEKEGRPSGDEIFVSDKPVKVGETWTKDPKKFAVAMFDAETAKSVDVSKSKVSFTLRSVEVRGGAEFGKITGYMELSFIGFGPFKLEQAIPMKITVECDACIDGKLREGELRMRGEMFGKSAANTEKGQVEVEIDCTIDSSRSIKSSK